MGENTIDAVVCDPPYALEFMGTGWDNPTGAGMDPAGYSDGTDRLPRPVHTSTTNPHCLDCGGTRRGRADRTGPVPVCGCPDGGRFPNVRAADMHRFQNWCAEWAAACLRVLKPGGHLLAFGSPRTWHRLAAAVEDVGFDIRDSIAWLYASGFPKSHNISAAIDRAAGAEPDAAAEDPATDAGQHWDGWGTALKPAFEPVLVARKPPAHGSIAANVLEYGTGGLNIDACRIPVTDHRDRDTMADGDLRWLDHAGRCGETRADGSTKRPNTIYGGYGAAPSPPHDIGRWPANVALDETQAGQLDRQSGDTHWQATNNSRAGSSWGVGDTVDTRRTYVAPKRRKEPEPANLGASRFMYTPKASQTERVTGPDGTVHPTVKPLSLIRWLTRLVTPPDGTVLDPFAGSGTTAEAAILERFRCVAVESEPAYLPLIRQRVDRAHQTVADQNRTPTLFTTDNIDTDNDDTGDDTGGRRHGPPPTLFDQ